MNPATTSVSPSVKATAQSFLAAREENKNSHTPAMKNHVEGFVTSLGSKAGEPLDRVVVEDLTTWIMGLPVRLKSATTNDHLKSVTALFAYGVSQGLCSTSVLKPNRKLLREKRAEYVAQAVPIAGDNLQAATDPGASATGRIEVADADTAGGVGKVPHGEEVHATDKANEAHRVSKTSVPGVSSSGDSSSSSSKHQPVVVKKLAVCEKCRLDGGCHHSFPADIEIPATGKCPATGWGHSKLYNLAKAIDADGKPLIKRSDKGRRLRFKGPSFCEWFWSQPESHQGKSNKECTKE